jgi:hypothetical protein
MESELVGRSAQVRTRHTRRHTAVSALGPLTAVAGVVWALLQPYRVTLLDPDKHGVWYLLIQPQLLLVLVAAVFHFLVVPGVLADLEELEGEA